MTRTSSSLAALLLATALVVPGVALAQSLVDATNIDSIANVALDYGSAAVEKDSAGDPMLSGQMGPTNYVVFFYGCTDGADCSTIQFVASWVNPGGVDMTQVHDWNRDRRFGKAYIDDENDPVLEMNVNLWGGVSETNLNDTFDWWRVLLESFEEYIGFEHAEEPAPPPEPPVTREAEADTPAAATGAPSALGMGQGSQTGGSKVKVNR